MLLGKSNSQKSSKFLLTLVEYVYFNICVYKTLYKSILSQVNLISFNLRIFSWFTYLKKDFTSF
jgi:hypothetical protein